MGQNNLLIYTLFPNGLWRGEINFDNPSISTTWAITMEPGKPIHRLGRCPFIN